MSVINQMLRDLQARELSHARPDGDPAPLHLVKSTAQANAVPVMAVPAPATDFRLRTTLIFILGVLLLSALAYRFASLPERAKTPEIATSETAGVVVAPDLDAALPKPAPELSVTEIPTPEYATPDTSADNISALDDIAPVTTAPDLLRPVLAPTLAISPSTSSLSTKSEPQQTRAAAIVSTEELVVDNFQKQWTLLQSLSDDAEALALAAQLFQEQPRHSALRLRYGELLITHGQYLAAIAVLQPAPKLTAHNQQHFALLALAEQQAGQHLDAIAHYSELTLLEPLRGQYWAGLAISLEHSGDTTSARLAWQKALSDGQLPAALRAYGRSRLAELAVLFPPQIALRTPQHVA